VIPNPLDPSPEEIRLWGEEASALIADYLGTVRDREVYPNVSAAAIRKRLPDVLSDAPVGFSALLDDFRDLIIPWSRHNGHPRMFGYVQSPGTALAAFADLLASTLNANLTAWRSAPVAVEIERATIGAIVQLLGLDAGAAGLFVSGGSMANLAALATARQAKGPADLSKEGSSALSRRMRLYASSETHHSIAKAAGLLGLGRANVRSIPVDEFFKIDLDQLRRSIGADTKAGHLPFCVVANAGTVNTGAIDALADVAAVAKEFGLWLHVDASYGGFAVLAQSVRPRFAGLDQADSISLDPHKWLYLPVDCGCVIYRDPASARGTFAHDAEYTRVFASETEEAFAFWDYGPELSRRFRALKVWMLLRGVGRRALAEAVENDLACARHLADLIRKSEDFELLAPVELSIVCFRYLPPASRESASGQNDGKIDDYNARLLVELQGDGSSYVSNSKINGKFSLRACIMNYRTTLADMGILLDDLRRVARSMASPD